MTAAVCAVLLLTIATAAPAGGSWLEPTWVRVEAGDTIALSGEVSTGQLGWVEDGPYFAYLNGAEHGTTTSEGPRGLETDVLLGELAIDPSDGWARVSIEFTLPADVPVGKYQVTVCNSPCRIGLGDLIGSTLYVGMDPPADEQPAGEKLAAAAALAAETAAPALDSAEAVGDSAKPAATSLTLARHPARSTGLEASWVAISVAFGLAVLFLVSVVRTKGG